MLRIEIRVPDGTSRIEEFEGCQRVTFGRASGNDLVLAPRFVSRFHGAFVFDEGVWTVVDNGSRTGLRVVHRDARPETLLKGEGRSAPLETGDEIRIMDLCMSLEVKPPDEALDGGGLGITHLHVSRVAEGRIADADSLQRKLQRDGDALASLLELAKDLNLLVRPEDVLERIGQTVFACLENASHFSICAPDAEGIYRPRFAASRDGSEPMLEIAVSQSILQQVVEKETAMLFRMTDAEVPSESVLLNAIHSSIAVPVRGSRGIEGIMLVENRASDHPFGGADLEFAIVLASSAAAALERSRHQADVKRMFDGFVDASVTAVEARDPTTSGHSRRVAHLSLALAEAVARVSTGPLARLRFGEEQLTELAYAALLHDFGKVAVRECVLLKASKLHPEQLERIEARFELMRALHERQILRQALVEAPERRAAALRACEARVAEFDRESESVLDAVRKLSRSPDSLGPDWEHVRAFGGRSFEGRDGSPVRVLRDEELTALAIPYGTLTHEERREMQAHVDHTHRVLAQIPWPEHLARVPQFVLQHHEKLDGSGYPHGVRADEIRVEGRILTVCDVYDAVTAVDRPYRSAMTLDGALDLLRRQATGGLLDAGLVQVFIEARVWERAGAEGGAAALTDRASR